MSSFADRAELLIAKKEAAMRAEGKSDEFIGEWRAKVQKAQDDAFYSRSLVNFICLYFSIIVIAWFASDWKAATKLTVPIHNPDLEFDKLGLPSTRPFPTFGGKGNKLELIGAGVRKKFSVVSVYSVGMYVDSKKKREMADKGSLSVLGGAGTGSNASLGFLLKFQREVGKDKVVTAIVEQLAIKGRRNYKEALDMFQTMLLKQISNKGDSVKKKDTIEFTYRNKALLCLSVNNQPPECVENADLRTRLLNVYAGEESVVPTLRSILQVKFLG